MKTTNSAAAERQLVQKIVADFTTNVFSKLIIENLENYFDDNLLSTLEDSFPNMSFTEFHNATRNHSCSGQAILDTKLI